MSDRDSGPALARLRGVAAVLILAVPLSGCVASRAPATDGSPAVVVPTESDPSAVPEVAQSPSDLSAPDDAVVQAVPTTSELAVAPVRPAAPETSRVPVRIATPDAAPAPVAEPEIMRKAVRSDIADDVQTQTQTRPAVVVPSPTQARAPAVVESPAQPPPPAMVQSPGETPAPAAVQAPAPSVIMPSPARDEMASPAGALADISTIDKATTLHRKEAADFIEVLAQLPAYLPFETTLAFERAALADDDFLDALRSEGKRRGYGVRDVTSSGPANEVRHVAEIADDGQVTRTISFGEAQMRRRFAPTEEGGWRAASSLFIRGVDASRVRLDSDPSQAPAQVDAQADAQAPAQAPAQADASVAAAPASVADESGAQSVADAADALPDSGATTPDRLADAALQPLERPRNVAELGQSNFAGVFEDYSNVEEIILVFSDDSMVLGDRNKKIIQSTVADVDAQTDLFSILGCSFGKSAIENGNEVLATGRATRVKEALVFAGVPAERILDEGCWAGAPKENFPGRGVVLTVKRARG